MGKNSKEIEEIKISEELYPSINLKRKIYKSSRIEIITDVPMDDSDSLGFPRNDLPEYV